MGGGVKAVPAAGGTVVRGSLRSQRIVEIQRARILAAMVEVSAEHGSGSVSVTDIVERAGISRRTFYALFMDRDDCFLAAFDDGVARVWACVRETYDPGARWVDRVRAALVALLSFLGLERNTGRLLIAGSLTAGAGALERRRDVLDALVELVDEGRREASVAGASRLNAEAIVGGVLSVLHSRLVERRAISGSQVGHVAEADPANSLLELATPLMGMIVLPYLGPAAARRELARPTPVPVASHCRPASGDPFRDVGMRLTYRTVRVLSFVGACPRSSNREIGIAAEVNDQGQISKLLTRLQHLGLIENSSDGMARGGANAWVLTAKGSEIERLVGDRREAAARSPA